MPAESQPFHPQIFEQAVEKYGEFEDEETAEVLLRNLNADYHVVHFGWDERVGAGDKDSTLSIGELVDSAYRFLPSNKTLVIGTHPLDYTRIKFDEKIYPPVLSDAQRQALFLKRQKEELERSLRRHGAQEGPEIFLV